MIRHREEGRQIERGSQIREKLRGRKNHTEKEVKGGGEEGQKERVIERGGDGERERERKKKGREGG